jgi:hypothetical protein
MGRLLKSAKAKRTVLPEPIQFGLTAKLFQIAENIPAEIDVGIAGGKAHATAGTLGL